MKRCRLRNRTPLKARTNADGKPREAFEGLRDEAKRTWIREQPCAIAGPHCIYARNAEGFYSDAEHVENKSRGKGDDSLIPLCHKHHMERHSFGQKSFEKEHHVRFAQLVGEYQLAWEKAKDMPTL